VSDHATGGTPRTPLLIDLSERQWRAVDAVTALIAFVLTVYFVRSQGGPQGAAYDWLFLLACAPIALRRRWPVPVLAVVTSATAALTALGQIPFELSAMLALAAYTVACQVPRRTSIGALIGAEAVLCVGLAVAGGGGAIGAEVAQSVLPLVAAWFVGDSLSARRTYLAGLAEQAELHWVIEGERGRQAIREERVQIARELHDVVAHSLAVMTVQAGVGRRLMAEQPEQAGMALESIEATGRTAQDELRVVLGLLRHDDTEHAELAPAPGLADLKELVEKVRAAGTPVELRTSGINHHISPALELSVYRVIQEALTNVVKHAPGAHATVDIGISAQGVRIEVADDGDTRIDRPPKPTVEQAAQSGSPHGIVGMHERVGAFGGTLVAEAVPGRGFRVMALIPLRVGP
jgi:signal transduction histidine kinase